MIKDLLFGILFSGFISSAYAGQPPAPVQSVAGLVGSPTASQLSSQLIGTASGTVRDAAAAIAAETAAQTTANNAVSAIALKQTLLIPTISDYLPNGTSITNYANGSLDSQSLITTALQSGPVALPCGTWLLNTAASIPLLHSLIGVDPACVTIKLGATTGDPTSGDVFTAVNLPHIRFGGFKFTSVATKTKGAFLHATATNDLQVNDITDFEQSTTAFTFYDLILLDGGSEFTHIDNSFLASTSHDCIGFYNGVIDTHLSHDTSTSCTNGLHINSASGVYADDSDFGASKVSGILVDPSSTNAANGTQGANGLFFDTILSDTSQNANWSFICADGATKANCGLISEVHINNSWAGGAGSINGSLTGGYPGFFMNNPKINGLVIGNTTVRYNGGHGIDVEEGTNIIIGAGTEIFMNGSSVAQNQVSPVYNGIYVAANAKLITISGSNSGTGGYDSAQSAPVSTNEQVYGLYHASGGTGKVKAVGNFFQGNQNSSQYLLQSGDTDLGNN